MIVILIIRALPADAGAGRELKMKGQRVKGKCRRLKKKKVNEQKKTKKKGQRLKKKKKAQR